MTTTERRRFTPGFLRTWRWRLLGWYTALLLVATLSSLFILRVVTLLQLEGRIDDELAQEAEELRALASGVNPETGELFAGDVESIFRVFLSRNVPNEHETFVTLVDGEAFLRSAGEVPVRLDLAPEAIAAWATTEGSARGTIQSEAGTVDYLAVELVGSDAEAVFVAAMFTDIMVAEAERPVLIASAVEGTVGLLVAGLLALVLTDRMVRPIANMTTTVRSITAGDLSRRVPPGEDDELGRLADTFNDMLDRLEEAFDAQRQFLADAGHELRTPITVVRGHLELMGEDETEREATLELIHDELARMSRMVDDILTLARAERPDFLAKRFVDLDELTVSVHRKATSLGDRDWQLDGVGIGIGLLDPDRITQAVLALADNAVGHTIAGDQISIGSRVVGSRVQIWVADTGSGIPEDELERIFDRFYRGAGSRRRPGSGLGLAIVSSVVLAHQGEVRVDSQPGEGTRFTLELPLESPEVEIIDIEEARDESIDSRG